ncbi:MAG: TerB family tellurite resistance protein [Pseudomonadota bacterium]
MIEAFKKIFEMPSDESLQEKEHRLRQAAAALMIETARADFSEDKVEKDELEKLLYESLDLSRTEVRELIDQASEQLDNSTSLYEFTRLINDHYLPAQKLELIGSMWRVAYADGRLDKYEEHLIRQVAELCYVSHEDYIKTKLSAEHESTAL